MKKSMSFKWDNKQQHVFDLIKDKLCFTLLLVLPDFSKTF